MSKCLQCGEREYAAFNGSARCEQCPSDSQRVVNSPGESIEECQCGEGYFRQEADEGFTCAMCPVGAVCLGGNMPPEATVGWWANVGQWPPVYHECIEVRGMSSTRCKGGSTSNQCAPNHKGPLCAQCESRHFVSASGRCTPCSDSGNLAAAIGIVTGVVFIGLPTSYILYSRMRVAWQHRSTTVFKILVAYYQILSVTRTGFHFDWPHTFHTVLEVISVAGLDINFDATQCATPLNYYEQVLTTTLLPPAAVLVGISSLKLVKRHMHPKQLESEHIYSTFICGLLLVVFAPVSRAMTQMFTCTSLSGEKQYLLADVSLECYTPEHYGWISYAVAGMVVYSMGIPAYFLLRLWRDRRANRLPLAILTQSYEDGFWWYESVELSRRFVLTNISTIVNPGTSVQLGFLITASLFFLCVHLQARPYRDHFCDKLSTATHVQLLLVLIFGLAFYQTGEEEENAAAEGVLVLMVLSSSIFLLVMLVVTSYQKRVLQQNLATKVTDEQKRLALALANSLAEESSGFEAEIIDEQQLLLTANCALCRLPSTLLGESMHGETVSTRFLVF